MTHTRIKPADLEELSMKKYFRMLEKDLTKLSKRSSLYNYVAIKNYQVMGKGIKKTVIFFIDVDDSDWEPMILNVMGRGTAYSYGKCKVVQVADRDGDGDEDITVGIKTAVGSLSKKNVMKFLKASLYPDDADVEFVPIKNIDDNEEDDENLEEKKIRAQRPKREAGPNHSLETFEGELKYQEQDQFIKPFLEALKAFYAGKTPKEIKASIEEKYKKIVASKNKKYIIKLDVKMDEKVEEAMSVIEKGKEWGTNYKKKQKELDNFGGRENRILVIDQMKQVQRIGRFISSLNAELEELYELKDADNLAEAEDYKDIKRGILTLDKIKEGGQKLMHISILRNQINSWLKKNKEDKTDQAKVFIREELGNLLKHLEEQSKKTTEQHKGLKEKFEVYQDILQKMKDLETISNSDFNNKLDHIEALNKSIERFESMQA